jgi:hypothetical protein
MDLSAQSLGLLITLAILIPTIIVVCRHSRQMDRDAAFHRASTRAQAAAYAAIPTATPKPKVVAITKPTPKPRAPRRSPAETASIREFRAAQARKRHHVAQTARNVARIENCKIGKTTW